MRWTRAAFGPAVLSVALHSQAVDARFVQVAKRVNYVQTNAGAPVVQSNGYEFRARVDLSTRDSVSSAQFRSPPTGTIRALTNLQTYLEFSQRFASSDSMNFGFPNGTYNFVTAGATDGLHTNQLTLSADFYPNPVHVANFAAAQVINPRNDFTLQWDSAGLGAGDSMQLRVLLGDQSVFETGLVPGAAGSLSGAALSALIPRNTLREGGTYRAQLIASRKSTSDSKGYPGVPAWAAYSRVTEFPMRTIYSTLDVSWYGLAKKRSFAQTSPAAPAPLASGGYAISAFAAATDPLNLQSASLLLPSGTAKGLSAAGPNWSWQQTFDSQTLLDGGFPSGTYSLQMQTAHNGTQKISLPVIVPVFPVPLQISNWNEASAIDPGASFPLKWLAPSGGSPDDFLQVIVRKGGQIIYHTGDYPGAPGSLDGTGNSVSLPAGLLLPGESAEVTLLYLKSAVRDIYSYPQALGMVACGCETRATIRARSADVPAPAIGGAALVNGGLEFNVSTVPGRLYVVQTSADLQTWSQAWATNAPATVLNLRFPVTPAFRTQSFRVIAN